MKKASFVIVSILMVIASVIVYFEQRAKLNSEEVLPIQEVIVTKSTPKSITYTIDGVVYQLVNGKAEVKTTPDSTSVNVLSIFGEPIVGDLDGDGDEDVAVLLSLTTGGSGTFYYAALALNENGEYVSTNLLILGDRIAPQTVEIHDGIAVFNYAERVAGEPMTTQPSIGKSIWIYLDKTTGQIGELIKDFEGEVDINRLALDMHSWTWVRTESSNIPPFVSKNTKSFVITFNKTTSIFSAQTDCNGVGGTYTANGNSISFTEMMSTLMFCEGSDEQTFTAMLGEVTKYSFGTKGELLLQNKDQTTTMVFQ